MTREEMREEIKKEFIKQGTDPKNALKAAEQLSGLVEMLAQKYIFI